MKSKLNHAINQLLQYGLDHHLITKEDLFYTANRLLNVLQCDEFQYKKQTAYTNLNEILDSFLEYGSVHHLYEGDSDLFDTEVMTCLTPRPSEVSRVFWEKYQHNPISATDYFYHMSIHSNYIRMDRIKKNLSWKTETSYGELDITINRSKPEKDPKLIALERSMPKKSYPKCLLCKENVGYKGRINHPARGNLRVIPVTLNKEQWYMQYSPYVYYHEHCIVLKDEHVPMKITNDTFSCLFDFIDLFPHYFIGSNADLPIVGGSILDHDHFQGGRYTFPMMKADVWFTYPFVNEVELHVLDWPLSVICLKSMNRKALEDQATLILNKWRCYCDPSIELYAKTTEQHSTITPIVRKVDETYEIYLVLRNNKTSDTYPYGIFHPREHQHHIKKENIGLIEVMGLAVLPSRLSDEMKDMEDYLKNGTVTKQVEKHIPWLELLKQKKKDMNLQDEIGTTFCQILETCSIFKKDQNAFIRFLETLGD